mmetsp:Transcript_6987/g.11746  ORF Transcript_6987/g.11746 Transcript_6987/m.11746 type:complete len:156 (-) Transcript_6987:48-515(-)
MLVVPKLLLLLGGSHGFRLYVVPAERSQNRVLVMHRCQPNPSSFIRLAAESPSDTTVIDVSAAKLVTSVTERLDEDWCEQSDHKRIAENTARLYKQARKAGTTDIGALLLAIGNGLEQIDMGDAFVGPWDIANMASDILMKETLESEAGDSCGCG